MFLVEVPKIIKAFRGEFRFLSNFYPSPLLLDGLLYPTVEHAYQAAKTFEINEKHHQIRLAESPGDAKRLGRTVKLHDSWESQKDEIMYNLVLEKFKIDSLKTALIATGNSILEEGNIWGDRYWGVDISGNGENRLGKILMRVRDEINYD